MKEKLQEYALIAEIIGGVAIVCSLLFVGVQIRQSAKISEVNAALRRLRRGAAVSDRARRDGDLHRLRVYGPREAT